MKADPVWGAGSWAVGDRASWWGVRLVCCTAHTTVEAAEHPWETIGWAEHKAAALWAPDGEVEAAKLRVVVQRAEELGLESPERMVRCAAIAAGR